MVGMFIRWTIAAAVVVVIMFVSPALGLVLGGIAAICGVAVVASSGVPEHAAIRENHAAVWGARTDRGPAPIAMPTRKRRYIAAETRMAVFKRDGEQCVVCGSRHDLTVDHIIAVSRGGSDDPENFQTLCSTCNNRKGAKLSMPDWRD